VTRLAVGWLEFDDCQGTIFSLSRPHSLWDLPSLTCKRYQGRYPRGAKELWRKTDNSVSSVEVKNAWSCIFTTLFAFIAWCLIKGINFFITKPTRCTNFTTLFWFEDSFQAGPWWSCSKAVFKPVWHIPVSSVQWIRSWWWADELSETCRVSCQNKFVKLVHLVGFIIKKFITMHGPMDVKKKNKSIKFAVQPVIWSRCEPSTSKAQFLSVPKSAVTHIQRSTAAGWLHSISESGLERTF